MKRIALLLALVLAVPGALGVRAAYRATFGRLWDTVTVTALAERAAAEYDGRKFAERDVYRMPSGIYCATFWPPQKIGKLEVYLQRDEAGRWQVSGITKDTHPVALRSSSY